MARKLLVTTDFSANSKGAIRFAIQFAAQTKHSLVFFHCLPLLRPSRWTDAQFYRFSENEKEKTTKALRRFALTIFRSSGVKQPKFDCIVTHGTDVKKAIVKQAKEINARAICLTTRGAGRLKKFVGSHTSSIIHASPVPVFVIPANYRRNQIKHIIYASDLNRIGSELRKVRALAKPLNARITVLHYDYLAHVKEARQKLEKVANKYESPNIKFRFRKYNIDRSLAFHLLNDIRTSKAALAVLFTNQRRGWFDRLFLSSKSVDVAYDAKIPLLIIPRD